MLYFVFVCIYMNIYKNRMNPIDNVMWKQWSRHAIISNTSSILKLAKTLTGNETKTTLAKLNGLRRHMGLKGIREKDERATLGNTC